MIPEALSLPLSDSKVAIESGSITVSVDHGIERDEKDRIHWTVPYSYRRYLSALPMTQCIDFFVFNI